MKPSPQSTLDAIDASANHVLANNSANSAQAHPFLETLDPEEIARKIDKDREVFQIVSPGHAVAENSMGLFWNKLCNHLIDKPPTNIEDLDKVASILHKVTSSGTQLNKVKNKLMEHFGNKTPNAQESDTPLQFR